MLYDHLKLMYGVNKPIFTKYINYNDMSESDIQKELETLEEKGLLKKYEEGIYYLPKEKLFGTYELKPDLWSILNGKYIAGGGNYFGYYTGLRFANELHLTTQVPASVKIVTNETNCDEKEVMCENVRVYLYKPKIPVTNDNWMRLQFLDLIEKIDVYSEVNRHQQRKIIGEYYYRFNLWGLEKYFGLYSPALYKNLYELLILTDEEMYGVRSFQWGQLRARV